MATFLLQDATTCRLDEIYHYTLNKWGQQQADNYIKGLFDTFANVVEKNGIVTPHSCRIWCERILFKISKALYLLEISKQR